MYKFVYAKWPTYEFNGKGDEAFEYAEAIHSNEKDRDIIIRHVIIGPKQKAWATCDDKGNDPEYCWVEHPFISEWAGYNKDNYIKPCEFKEAWRIAGGLFYNEDELQKLAAFALNRK